MRRRGSGSGSLRWLALAGLGAAAVVVAKRLLAADRGWRERGLATHENDELAAKVVEGGFNLPDDVEISSIAGPRGSLRVGERHPNGRLSLIFVHGLGGRLEQWGPVLSRLGPGLRAIAMDLPGHGQSDGGPDLKIADLAAAINAVADSFGLRRFVLVGHSLGALATIDYAGRHGDRLFGLLLVDPNGDNTLLPEGDRDQLIEAVAADPHVELRWYWQQILGDADPEVARRVFADLEATPAEALVELLRSSFQHSPLPALDHYLGPLHSVISPLNDLPHSLHQLRPRLEVSTIVETSHWLMMDRPQDFCEVLWRFLEGL